MSKAIKYQISNRQYAALNWAIDMAENPGRCSYVKGCVVGKLCIYYGVPNPKYDDGIYGGANIAKLPFPPNLLSELQAIWDSSRDVSNQYDLEDRREELRQKLNTLVEVIKQEPAHV